MSARAKRAMRSKQMSEQCERTSKLKSEWPSAQCVNFIHFQPNVQRGPISRTESITSNFHGLPCTRTLAQWLANSHNATYTTRRKHQWPMDLVACSFPRGFCARFARNHTRTFLRFFHTKCDKLKLAGLKCHEIGLLSFGAS